MNSTRQHRAYSDTKSYKTNKMIKSLAAATAGILMIAVFHASSRWLASDQDSRAEAPSPATSSTPQILPVNNVKAVSKSQLQSVATSHLLPLEIQALVEGDNFTRARKRLMQLASLAVESEDDHQLAEMLSHLAEVALLQKDMDTAEVYLVEALDLFNQTHDEISAAGVYQQMGRLHLIVRQRARLASAAYDTLLVARWKISNGQFYSAETDLRRAAEDNLSLNRYGAAASAYETLYRGYKREGDSYQAQLAGVEAVKLHASSGRTFDAEAILDNMRRSGLNESEFFDLQTEIVLLNQEFNQSVLAIGTARDQAQLYNQLQARGDVVNAWRFRQQAGASLAKASTRAQHRRQPDVLVQLYKSNFSMKHARASLQRAQEVYERHGMDTQALQNLKAQIF